MTGTPPQALATATIRRSAIAIPDYDPIVSRYQRHPLSFLQAEAMADLWSMGEDGWLREDCRFSPTPWGRWILTGTALINDAAHRALRDELAGQLSLAEQLATLTDWLGQPTAYCPGDPRLVLTNDVLRLAATELSEQPLIEVADERQQFVTHLPVLSLVAAAASVPAGDWGGSQQPQDIRPLGWLRVEGMGRSLRPSMFVARIRGESMDGGKLQMANGSWAVFEFAFHAGIAYDPGTARPVVLVRGSFEDPETGTFAVKLLVRETDGARLVSANPDKARYPDIVVNQSDLADVRVIATLTKPLHTGDFTRRPRVHAEARRSLDTKAGMAEIAQRLAENIERFFHPLPSPHAAEKLGPSPSGARLVCLAPEFGGPHVAFAAVERLPRFVKKCRVLGEPSRPMILASRLRSGQALVGVTPGEGPWTLEAVDFEDEPESLGLHNVFCPTLSTESATAFRVDRNGVGQALAGLDLLTGHRYRLLCPPQLTLQQPAVGTITPAAGGWAQWDLDLEVEVSAQLAAQLAVVGLSVAGSALCIQWAVAPPAQWRQTAGGVAYPAFALGSPIAVTVSDWPGGEAARVFLAGPALTEPQQLAVQPGDAVQLADLALGEYVCSIWHPDRQFATDFAPFEVIPVAPLPALVGLRFTLEATDGTVNALASGEGLDLDLGQAHAFAPPTVSLAPGWPLRVSWRTDRTKLIAQVVANEFGEYELTEHWQRLVDKAQTDRVADVDFDFGEFGIVTLRHTRGASVEAVQPKLATLAQLFAAQLATDPGQWDVWMPLWFGPILELLGYEVDGGQAGALPVGAQARRLSVVERTPTGLCRSPWGLLVLTSDVELKDATAAHEVRALMHQANATEALITDGIYWTLRRRVDGKSREVHRIPAAVGDPALLRALLDALGVGV